MPAVGAHTDTHTVTVAHTLMNVAHTQTHAAWQRASVPRALTSEQSHRTAPHRHGCGDAGTEGEGGGDDDARHPIVTQEHLGHAPEYRLHHKEPVVKVALVVPRYPVRVGAAGGEGGGSGAQHKPARGRGAQVEQECGDVEGEGEWWAIEGGDEDVPQGHREDDAQEGEVDEGDEGGHPRGGSGVRAHHAPHEDGEGVTHKDTVVTKQTGPDGGPSHTQEDSKQGGQDEATHTKRGVQRG